MYACTCTCMVCTGCFVTSGSDDPAQNRVVPGSADFGCHYLVRTPCQGYGETKGSKSVDGEKGERAALFWDSTARPGRGSP